jgi:ABC-type bacteriocin/lantibiotic exporter with double-glycine peptidase domain
MLRGLIERLSENVKSFMEVRAYIKELDDFIGQPSAGQGAKKASWHSITMKNVTFTYQATGDTIYIPEFSIKAGQKICIEGRSGQGKSTFLGLLTNAFQPQEGVRKIDTTVYESVSRSFFEDQVAVISQETELFHLSVRDNLTLGQTVDDDSLLGHLNELGMREWFDGLDNGFDSIIGEKGVTLSAGQRQRLNILRGVILNRSLYVLDEPTSHLDSRTEETVVSFLRKHLADKSVVIVTHRPALRRVCEVSYEMRDHRLTRA